MPEKRWEFELDGAQHAVELEHNTFTNKQSVRADGRLLQPQAGMPVRHAFRIESHTCEVVVEKRGGKFAYDFLIDGIPSTPERYSFELAEAQTSERMKSMRWGAISIFLTLGIGGMWFNWTWAHTRGYYYDEIALVDAWAHFHWNLLGIFPEGLRVTVLRYLSPHVDRDRDRLPARICQYVCP